MARKKTLKTKAPRAPLAPGRKVKSQKGVAFLLSSGSPLTTNQKDKLERELSSGKVKVRG